MQPLKILTNWLNENTNEERYLFTSSDLRGLFPELSQGAFKVLISRASRNNHFEKVCRGLYAYKPHYYSGGRLLFHAASQLRSHEFNYISLETTLSESGVISQLPINTISIMSSGRSNKISCGRFGLIEFIHTNQRPEEIMNNLTYDQNCRLWRANVPLALSDMKRTRRNCDLINWDMANEFV